MGQSAVWCRWQGNALKCSPEQLRPLAPEEEIAMDAVPEDWKDLEEPGIAETRGRQKNFQDLTGQAGPEGYEPTKPPDLAGEAEEAPAGPVPPALRRTDGEPASGPTGRSRQRQLPPGR